MYTDSFLYINQKGNFIMKSVIATLLALSVASVFAAETPKAPATPAPAATASAPVPAVTANPAPHKTEKKAKKEVAKADATKSATPTVAKDTKTEAVKK
jgi:hypothetical protein